MQLLVEHLDDLHLSLFDHLLHRLIIHFQAVDRLLLIIFDLDLIGLLVNWLAELSATFALHDVHNLVHYILPGDVILGYLTELLLQSVLSAVRLIWIEDGLLITHLPGVILS